MASCHFSVQVLQRSKGRSAVAAAAYRSGTQLRDERTGGSHDYRGRHGVVWAGILLPDGAPAFLKDRQQLWNHAEGLEARGDAQLAREINLALPRELDVGQRRDLLLGFVREAFVDRGMVADVAIHEPVPGKNSSPDNHHAHIMLALRRVTRAGLHPVKTREWNARELLKQWRALWADHQNRALERAGHLVRVDHRTLEVQREDALRRRDRVAAALLDRRPQVHVGVRAMRVSLRENGPVSRARPVGPRRRVGPGKAVRRVVRYPMFDQGTRRAHHGAAMAVQWQRWAAKVGALRSRGARLRLRKVALMREDAALREKLRRLAGQQWRYRWLEKRRARPSLDAALQGVAMKLALHRRRAGALERMLAEVDRTMAKLVLELARPPGRFLTGRPAMRPGRGRVRARLPSASSRPGRDNGAPFGRG